MSSGASHLELSPGHIKADYTVLQPGRIAFRRVAEEGVRTSLNIDHREKTGPGLKGASGCNHPHDPQPWIIQATRMPLTGESRMGGNKTSSRFSLKHLVLKHVPDSEDTQGSEPQKEGNGHSETQLEHPDSIHVS